VACDYVINGWLRDMGLGEMPAVGGLYDPELKNLSAEAIYDRIVTDLRRYRKLCTLRGIGLSDIIERGTAEWWRRSDGMALDEWYRQCLSQGLVYHESSGRGLLPLGLVEEIRALDVPPIAWDVELAQWFDRYFPPQEKVRSYARASRRQSATPDIARPRWVTAPDAESGRTFGVVLDTSGSMDRQLLAKALGAIASYSLARDVPAARVVFCDAQAYDQGYMPPEDIAERVQVRGRGGTVLQPGIDLLENAENFPKTGPLLIITDGDCDRVRVRREHAFLLPVGHSLPFVPKGEVFRIR
jgi:predicted metal-dependent peptidase